MRRRAVLMTLAIGALGLLRTPAWAQAAGVQQQVYGWQLMTQQERLEHRNRMRNAATEEERARIRQEHHLRMTERARQRGVTLPDQPPARGMGGGTGRGGGQGMGQGMGGMTRSRGGGRN